MRPGAGTCLCRGMCSRVCCALRLTAPGISGRVDRERTCTTGQGRGDSLMGNREEEQLLAEEKNVQRRVRRYRPIRSLFLIVVFSDHDSRPALFYALLTLAL